MAVSGLLEPIGQVRVPIAGEEGPHGGLRETGGPQRRRAQLHKGRWRCGGGGRAASGLTDVVSEGDALGACGPQGRSLEA